MEYSEVSGSLPTDLVNSSSYWIIKSEVETEIDVPFFILVGFQKVT